jgi:hypothetical protein
LQFCEDIVVYRHLACKQQAALLSFDLIFNEIKRETSK